LQELEKLIGGKFEPKNRTQQSVHLTGGILRHFRAFSTPEQNPALGVLSTPAHPQVTQAVKRFANMNQVF
jgi:hypothetical protein